MDIIDLIIFFIYIVGIAVFGGSFFKKNRSSASFTLGDKNVPGWVVTMSIFATFVSSISYLALPGNAFQSNWNAFAFSLSLPIASYISVMFFVPLYRKINSPSAYTYMGTTLWCLGKNLCFYLLSLHPTYAHRDYSLFIGFNA